MRVPEFAYPIELEVALMDKPGDSTKSRSAAVLRTQNKERFFLDWARSLSGEKTVRRLRCVGTVFEGMPLGRSDWLYEGAFEGRMHIVAIEGEDGSPARMIERMLRQVAAPTSRERKLLERVAFTDHKLLISLQAMLRSATGDRKANMAASLSQLIGSTTGVALGGGRDGARWSWEAHSDFDARAGLLGSLVSKAAPDHHLMNWIPVGAEAAFWCQFDPDAVARSLAVMHSMALPFVQELQKVSVQRFSEASAFVREHWNGSFLFVGRESPVQIVDDPDLEEPGVFAIGTKDSSALVDVARSLVELQPDPSVDAAAMVFRPDADSTFCIVPRPEAVLGFTSDSQNLEIAQKVLQVEPRDGLPPGAMQAFGDVSPNAIAFGWRTLRDLVINRVAANRARRGARGMSVKERGSYVELLQAMPDIQLQFEALLEEDGLRVRCRY